MWIEDRKDASSPANAFSCDNCFEFTSIDYLIYRKDDSMYLDPGFGGMLLQVIVAIAAVGGGIIYSFRKKIGGLFKKDNDKPKKAVSSVSEAEEDAIDVLDEK